MTTSSLELQQREYELQVNNIEEIKQRLVDMNSGKAAIHHLSDKCDFRICVF